MRSTFNRYASRWLLSILLSGLLFSCTKKEDLPAQPQNRIVEYKVANTPAFVERAMYGVVDNEENSITVYVPFLYYMEVIDPAIKLDEGATLKETPEPVSITDTTRTYTVTGKNGSVRTYKLHIQLQGTYTLRIDQSWAANKETTPNSKLSVFGTFLSTSTQTFTVDLINQRTGKSTAVDMSSAGISPVNDFYEATFVIPPSIDSGTFHVKLAYQGHKADLPALHIGYVAPTAGLGYRTIKQGATMVLPADAGKVFFQMQSAQVSVNDTWYDLTIVSSDYTSAVVRFPDNIPTGTFWGAPAKFKYGGWAGEISQTFGYLIVEPK